MMLNSSTLTTSEIEFVVSIAMSATSSILVVAKYDSQFISLLGSGSILGNGVKVYCIDTFEANSMIPAFMSDTVSSHLHEVIVPLVGSSDFYSKMLDLKDASILFIDSIYERIDVEKAIMNWIPKVRTGGIIIFNNYNRNVGVTRAIGKWLMNEMWFELVYKHGRLIAFRKKQECFSGKSELLIAVKVGDRESFIKRSLTSLIKNTAQPVDFMLFLDKSPKSVQSFVRKTGLQYCYFEQKQGLVKLTRQIFSYAIEHNYIFLYHADDDFVYNKAWKDQLIDPLRHAEIGVSSGFCHPNIDLESVTEIQISGVSYYEISSVIGGSCMFKVEKLKKINWWEYTREGERSWDLVTTSALSKITKVICVKNTVCQHIGRVGTNLFIEGQRFLGEN